MRAAERRLRELNAHFQTSYLDVGIATHRIYVKECRCGEPGLAWRHQIALMEEWRNQDKEEA